MIIEDMICEACGGKVGTVGRQYICRVCRTPVSDESIERSLDKMFESEKEEL